MNVPLHRHLSDLRTGLMLRRAAGPVAADLVRKADLCANALAESRRLIAGGSFGPTAQFLARAAILMDELDELLLALDHQRDQAVFIQLHAMRRELSELETRRAAAHASTSRSD